VIAKGGESLVCKEPQCTRSIYARGYCKYHYNQKRQAGEFKKYRKPKHITPYSCNGSTAILHFKDRYSGRPVDIYIDIEDLEKVISLKWAVSEERPYASTWHKNGTFLMHRLLINAPSSMMVDHINRNPRDNRKANLRICTAKENAQNRDNSRAFKRKEAPNS
jgi:hypothetical protein